MLVVQFLTATLLIAGRNGGENAGCSKRPSARPQRAKRRDVPLWYVEALSDARTKLGAFFNILLHRIAFGVGVFEFQPHAWAGEIGIEDAVLRGQRAIEQHMFDPDVIVKIFQMAQRPNRA